MRFKRHSGVSLKADFLLVGFSQKDFPPLDARSDAPSSYLSPKKEVGDKEGPEH